MTQRKIQITVLAFLMSAALALPTASAAKNDAPPSQKVTVKTIIGFLRSQRLSVFSEEVRERNGYPGD